MGDKKKGKAEKVIIDGVETSDMKFSKLQEFAQSLLQKLIAARKDRKFLQVQCVQLRTAWEISKTKMQQCEDRIKSTALNRDVKEQEIGGELIKRINEEEKYIDFLLDERLKTMRTESANILKDMYTMWDDSTLKHLLEQKTILKMKLDQDIEDVITTKDSFQQKIDDNTANLIKKMDDETEKILNDITARLNKCEKHLSLLSDTAFFRNQEDYNKIITELMENGKKNTAMLREFYKRITEDDIILILVLEKQVRKLSKIVRKKQIQCKKINEQTLSIESSKGELEMNLGRAKRKMKLYDTNTLALIRANYMCDKMINRKQTNSKALFDIINKEKIIEEKLQEKEKYVEKFYDLFLERQREVVEPLVQKIKILTNIIKRDKEHIKSIIPTLPTEVQELVNREKMSLDKISEECMTYLLSNLTRLCASHDNLIDFVERSLDNINNKNKYKLNLKKINFDVTSYGIGPVGELISTYP